MEIEMSKKVDKRRTTLTITRIVAIFSLVISLVLMLDTVQIFNTSGEYISSAESHLNSAEDQEDSLDGLAALITGYIGLVAFGGSLLVFVIALIATIVTTKKLYKRPDTVSVPAMGETVSPQIHATSSTASSVNNNDNSVPPATS